MDKTVYNSTPLGIRRLSHDTMRFIMGFMKKKQSSHPGKLIRECLIEKNGLSVTEAAKIMKVGRQALSALLNSRAALSPEMAFRIEKAFGIRMDITMRMQLAYDLACLRDRDSEFAIEPFTTSLTTTKEVA